MAQTYQPMILRKPNAGYKCLNCLLLGDHFTYSCTYQTEYFLSPSTTITPPKIKPDTMLNLQHLLLGPPPPPPAPLTPVPTPSVPRVRQQQQTMVTALPNPPSQVTRTKLTKEETKPPQKLLPLNNEKPQQKPDHPASLKSLSFLHANITKPRGSSRQRGRNPVRKGSDLSNSPCERSRSQSNEVSPPTNRIPLKITKAIKPSNLCESLNNSSQKDQTPLSLLFSSNQKHNFSVESQHKERGCTDEEQTTNPSSQESSSFPSSNPTQVSHIIHGFRQKVQLDEDKENQQSRGNQQKNSLLTLGNQVKPYPMNSIVRQLDFQDRPEKTILNSLKNHKKYEKYPLEVEEEEEEGIYKEGIVCEVYQKKKKGQPQQQKQQRIEIEDFDDMEPEEGIVLDEESFQNKNSSINQLDSTIIPNKISQKNNPLKLKKEVDQMKNLVSIATARALALSLGSTPAIAAVPHTAPAAAATTPSLVLASDPTPDSAVVAAASATTNQEQLETQAIVEVQPEETSTMIIEEKQENLIIEEISSCKKSTYQEEVNNEDAYVNIDANANEQENVEEEEQQVVVATEIEAEAEQEQEAKPEFDLLGAIEIEEVDQSG